MMRPLKKAILAVLVLALVLCLWACGKKPQNTNTANDTAPEENTAPVPSGSTENDPTIDPDFGIDDKDKDKDADPVARDTLVVYFSATGNTKAVAERIAKTLGADIFEIVPEEPYTTEDLNYNDKSTRATKEQNDSSARPAIAGEMVQLDSYTTIYLGYPIWWGEAPRIMCTFVENYSFGDILIIPFCTSGSSSIGSSAKNLEKLATGGLWAEGGRLDKDISDEDLKDWIQKNH